MKNPRETVELRRFHDGRLTDVRIERRVVRTRKDGTRFVRGLHGDSPLTQDMLTGMWYWTIHFTTGRATTFAELLQMIKAKQEQS